MGRRLIRRLADPGREQDYVPALETIGFGLAIHEPWWYGHRVLRMDEPPCNLHVFGFDSPELVRHRIFRDWLRGNPDQRARYAAAKREAASEKIAELALQSARHRPRNSYRFRTPR